MPSFFHPRPNYSSNKHLSSDKDILDFEQNGTSMLKCIYSHYYWGSGAWVSDLGVIAILAFNLIGQGRGNLNWESDPWSIFLHFSATYAWLESWSLLSAIYTNGRKRHRALVASASHSSPPMLIATPSLYTTLFMSSFPTELFITLYTELLILRVANWVL